MGMDTQRLFLYMGVLFIGMLIYQAWVLDYGPKPEPVVATGNQSGVIDSTANNQGSAPAVNNEDLPSANTVSSGSAVSNSETATPATTEVATTSQRISITTDVVNAVVDTTGGTIVGIDLLKYPKSIDEKDIPFTLASDTPGRFLIAQSGLQGVGETKGRAPTHKAIYTAEQTSYELGEDNNQLVVPLFWQSEDGVKVTKTLTFTRDSYEILVDYKVDNTTDKPWEVNQYQQLQRKPVTKDETQKFLYTYIGGVASTDEKRYEKIKFDDMEDENLNVRSVGGYVAMIQHYFAGAWIPSQEEENTFYTIHLRNANRYIIGMNSSLKTVQPQSTGNFQAKAYIGPKVQEWLKKAAPHLELTVDFGWLTILAQPLFWLLKTIHSMIGNWGWSIIILTCMIKAVFYKLSKASYTSMARMKKLQPKLQSLKERYGDDRAKMGQATMDLYKKEKVNPLGGCLPMLVQIPVFIALYWTLLESVELRQAPWMFWIKDLAIKDPLFILPVIMGLTMFIQQKLNPAPVDPIQAKVFLFLPLFFSVFFAFFPAGLVLYWCVNNTLSILQQYYITRHVLAEK